MAVRHFCCPDPLWPPSSRFQSVPIQRREVTVSEEPDRHVCSARGCQADAVWDLLWNNPRIHTPDRRKTWLACDEHRQSLSDFLGARGFLRDVVAHDAG